MTLPSFVHEVFAAASVQDAWVEACRLVAAQQRERPTRAASAASAGAAAASGRAPTVPLAFVFPQPLPSPAPSVVVVNNSDGGSSSRRGEDDEEEQRHRQRQQQEVASLTWREVAATAMLLIAAGAALFGGIRSTLHNERARSRQRLAQEALLHTQAVFVKYAHDTDAVTLNRRLRALWHALGQLDQPAQAAWQHPSVPWALVGGGLVTGAVSILVHGSLRRSFLGYATVLMPAAGVFWWAAMGALQMDEPSRDEVLRRLGEGVALLEPHVHAPSAPEPYTDGPPPPYVEQ